MRATAQPEPVNQEAALLDYVQRLKKHRAGRRAVHVRLSRLRPYRRRPHHLRIAATTFDRLVRDFDGALFKMLNGDMIAICKDATVADIDRAVLHLRYLFSEDPLLKGDESGREPFCTWFELEPDYPALLTLAQEMVAAREYAEPEADDEDETAGIADAPSMPLDPAKLAVIETAIAQADLSTMIFRQPICAVVAGRKPEPVFCEIFTSIEYLRRTLMPAVNIHADRWLFQYLTQALDHRMIAYLAHSDDPQLQRAFSVNLNVCTLLSPEFLEFDGALNSGLRRSIVIELQLIDVLADLGNFLFARDFLRERGYKFCLDGMTHLSLPLIDRGGLGFDLVKLMWSADLCDQLGGVRGEALREAAQRIGQQRIILARCDSEQSLDVGRSLGIALYQGHLLDAMLVRETTREDTVHNLADALARQRVANRLSGGYGG